LIVLPRDPTIGLRQWAVRDNIERMRREREAYADASAIVEQFNAQLPRSPRGSGRRLLLRSLQNITG
jgi:hypothetical protein